MFYKVSFSRFNLFCCAVCCFVSCVMESALCFFPVTCEDIVIICCCMFALCSEEENKTCCDKLKKKSIRTDFDSRNVVQVLKEKAFQWLLLLPFTHTVIIRSFVNISVAQTKTPLPNFSTMASLIIGNGPSLTIIYILNLIDIGIDKEAHQLSINWIIGTQHKIVLRVQRVFFTLRE